MYHFHSRNFWAVLSSPVLLQGTVIQNYDSHTVYNGNFHWRCELTPWSQWAQNISPCELLGIWDGIVGYLTWHEAYCLWVGYHFQVIICTHKDEVISWHLTVCKSASFPMSWRLTVCRGATFHDYITNRMSKKSHDFILVWRFELKKRKIQSLYMYFYCRHEINCKKNPNFFRCPLV